MIRTLITGGAGFVGTNVAHRLLAAGESVLLFDNLSRPGVERNLQELSDLYGNLVEVEIADMRDHRLLGRAVAASARVFHFAAQVAVTTSLADPLEDFTVNARGTLNLLEAIRARSTPPPLVFTSTNKVYGALDNVPLRRDRHRYEPVDAALREHGMDERQPLDFHSPYGCSKGAADQYVLDYARCFGLPAIVFRMSCIYGPYQCGNEDQGWVAHFVLRTLEQEPVTLYGDGQQVRDVLFVDDLVEALLLAQQCMATQSGQVFNIGGGPQNAVSLLDMLHLIAEATERVPAVTFEDWRLGDQRYYVSNTSKFEHVTGWRPRVGVDEGVRRLAQWLAGRLSATPESAQPAAGAR